MALSLVKNTSNSLTDRPHTTALRENLKAITDTRARLMDIHKKDRDAKADQDLCEVTQQRIDALRDEMDRLRAEAKYANQAPPDLRSQEKALLALGATLKKQQDGARAATLIRHKFAADMQKLADEISALGTKTDRLTWLAGYEDELANLAPEYLEKEAAYLDVRRRVFAAAALCDALSRENHYGQYVGAGLGADFSIPRPQHRAYDDRLTPEQSYAERERYSQSIASGAQALVRELRGTEAS